MPLFSLSLCFFKLNFSGTKDTCLYDLVILGFRDFFLYLYNIIWQKPSVWLTCPGTKLLWLMWLGLPEQHIQIPGITYLLPQALATWGKFCSPNHPDKAHPRTYHGLMSGYELPHALGLTQEEADQDTCLLPYSEHIAQPSSQPDQVHHQLSCPGPALIPSCPSKQLFLEKSTVSQQGKESLTHWRGSCLLPLLCSSQRFWSVPELLTSASSPKQEIQQLSSLAQKLSF